jgi:HlyD family secretion protein
MAQHMAIKTQIRLLEGDFAAKSDLLDRGLTPGDRVLALERDLAALRGRLGELAALKAEARGRITEIEIEITALATQSREVAEAELRDLVAQRIALAERAAALGLRITRLDLRAPAAGLVFGLRVTGPGAVLRPAEAVLSIVPQDRPLLVAARVPVTDVEEVRPGQEVRLVFSALPARTAPELVGRVTRISADRLTDTQTGQSYFRAEIAIGAEVLNGLGGARVLPGMPVDAFIRTADRSPLSYLLQPFTTYFRHAFRET